MLNGKSIPSSMVISTATDLHLEAVSLSGSQGCALAASRSKGRAPSILFAHGFGQTRGAWTGAAAAITRAGYATLSYDARGHGESAWNQADVPYSGDQFTDDLIVIAGEHDRPPVLVAASMGGLFGLVAESRWPGLFSAMVLVDITPRWDTRGVERILAFMTAHPDGFASLEAAADIIAAYMPHRPRKSEDALRALLRPTSTGRWTWHWDPRLVEELARDSEQHQSAIADAARRVECPVLLVSGGRSDLVTPQTISEFLSLVPHAQHVHLPDATHMVAGDDNNAFTAAVLNYLDALPSVSAAASSAITEHVNGASQ